MIAGSGSATRDLAIVGETSGQLVLSSRNSTSAGPVDDQV